MLYRLPDDQEYGWKVSCWCSSWIWSPWTVIYWYKLLLSSGIKLLKGVWVRWLGKMRDKSFTTQFIIDDSWIWILFWMEFSLNLAKGLNHIYILYCLVMLHFIPLSCSMNISITNDVLPLHWLHEWLKTISIVYIFQYQSVSLNVKWPQNHYYNNCKFKLAK